MKVFLDANILVTVLCNEYPQFTFCSRVISLCDNPKFEVYTSPICLAIAFYFAEKKSGNVLARKKIGVLSSKLRIAAVNESAVQKASSYKAAKDFEDGLEYYAAINSGCKAIVTHYNNDFYFSQIPVVSAEQFLLKYVAAVR